MLLATLTAVWLSVSPQTGFAPLSVRAKITIEPNYLNRMLCLVWEGETYGGSSCWQVEGQYAAKTHWYIIHNLPMGHYEVWAELVTAAGSTKTPTVTVVVAEGMPR